MPKKAPKITPKLKAELEAMIAAIKVVSRGWEKIGDSYVRSGNENGNGWDVFSEDLRALLCIDLLKSFSDAAVRTQYGRKALELLREVQDRPKVETQKLLDFYHEIEAAESRKQGYDDTLDLGLEVEETPEQTALIETIPRVVTESITKLTREARYIPTNGDALMDFAVDDKQKIKIEVGLTLPEERDLPEGITLKRGRENWKLTDTDLMIQDAIGSMYRSGKTNWTLNDLSVMMGGTRKISPKRRAELENMVEVQRVVKFYLNWKNQLRDLKKHLKDKDPDRYAILKKVSSIVDDEYLLSLTKREVTLQNGQKVIMYHTLAFPPVNEYSWNAGQIKDVPIAALSIPGVNLTAENDTIVRHLHFIVAIADRKKKPQNAYLETILERLTPVHEDAEPSKDGEQDGKKTAEKAADQDEQDGEKKGFSRMERARIAERVTKCLEHFTEINFIKKYEPIQGARGKVTGWTIYPTKKK